MPGPGFPGARGNSRRGLQKPKCLSERNSNFLPKQSLRRRRTGLTLFFLSLFIFQPAGLVILFFSYYKRSQLQHTRKKTHLPSPGRALWPQPPGWPPVVDKGSSSLWHPLGETQEPPSNPHQSQGHSRSEGRTGEVSASSKPSLAPGNRAAFQPS